MANDGNVMIGYIVTLCCMLISAVVSAEQNDTFVDYVLSEHQRFCHADRLCSFNETNLFVSKCRICPPCQCDDACKQYGDCCPDHSPALTGKQHSTTHDFRYQCQNDSFKIAPSKQPTVFFFSISKCSVFSDPQLVALCHSQNTTDPYESRPVTSAISGDVFKNKFCARCNGESSYVSWDIMVNCTVSVAVPSDISASEILNHFTQHSDCSIFYNPPRSTRLRVCYVNSENLITSCNETGLWQKQDDLMERACGSYYNPIFMEYKGYKNIFCLLCNSMPFPPLFKLCVFDIPYPFSVLMDPGAAKKIRTKTKQSCRCKDTEVFDRFKKICRPTLCSFGRRQDGKTCVAGYISAKGSPYSFEVILTPVNHMATESIVNVAEWMDSLASNTTKAFITKTRGYGLQIHRLGLRAIKKVNENRVLKLFFLVKFVLVSETNLTVFEKLLIDIQTSRWSIPFQNRSVNMSSASSLTLTNSDVDYTQTNSSTTEGGRNSWTYGKIIKQNTASFRVLEPRSYTTVVPTLFCPLVRLDLDETNDYSEKNHTLLLVVLNSTLTPDEFIISSNGTVSICQEIIAGTETCLALSPEVVFSKAYIIVSSVCQGISLVCLFMTLIVFCLLPPLRTLPGKTTMGLISTLLIAVTLNLFGLSRVENPIVCKAIGVLIHFFLLSSFTWMWICSLHMYRVFRNVTMSRKSTSNDRRLFAVYFSISLLVPFLINVAVIAINYAINGPRDIGYGHFLCYVSNFYSIIMGVLAPITIVVLFNGVLFVLTIVSLRKMSHEHENLTGKKENVYQYVKLSSLTGLNWLFAFVAPLTGIQPLWYVFAVLCGLQGFYIFLAFVCNRRVLTLFKEMCRGQGKKSGVPTKTPSTIRHSKISKDSSKSTSITSFSTVSKLSDNTQDVEQNNTENKDDKCCDESSHL